MTVQENSLETLLDTIDAALARGTLPEAPSSGDYYDALNGLGGLEDLTWVTQTCCWVARRIAGSYTTVPPGYSQVMNSLFDAANRLIDSDANLYRAFADEVSCAADLDYPWKRISLNRRGLAILYNFVPFADTGASVASKRLREMGSKVDVISCSSLGKKNIDSTPYRISRPYINRQTVLPLGPAWGSWRPQAKFIQMALDNIEQFQKAGANYDFIYTRAMWVPSHYVGAFQKLRQPEMEWIAEFSDPLSLDVNGDPRSEHPPENDPDFEQLLQELESSFGTIPEEEQGIFRMAELLPYAFADTIVFTNELQRVTMLEHISNDALRHRVETKSVVSNHPTLPAQYYDLAEPQITLNKGELNIGYFGDFYASRGLRDVTRAMRMLPRRLQKLLKLHVFTTFVPEKDGGVRPVNMKRALYDSYVARTIDALGDSGLEGNIVLHPSLPYTEFLAVLEKFDYLIVNDAESGKNHTVNPYLPSKYGDYKGSSSPTWALCEPDSCLSMSAAEVKTPLGDVNQTRAFLYQELSTIEACEFS